MKYTENYNLNKPENDDFYNVNDFNQNMDTLDFKVKEIEEKVTEPLENQSVEYTETSTLSALVSGEKLSVAFGKISKAISELISHISAKAASGISGHVKLSDSNAVTDSTGLALPATEKNANLPNTLANRLATIEEKLSIMNNVYRAYNTADVTLNADTFTEICSMNIPAGEYLIIGQISWLVTLTSASIEYSTNSTISETEILIYKSQIDSSSEVTLTKTALFVEDVTISLKAKGSGYANVDLRNNFLQAIRLN